MNDDQAQPKQISALPQGEVGVSVWVEDREFDRAVIRDISEHRKAEDNMPFHLSVFETPGVAVVITDPAERIIAVNSAFTEITGYSEVELVGQTPRTLSSGRQDKAFYERMWASLFETGRWKGEIWDRRKGGQVYPQWLSISAIRDAAGQVINYVAFFSDISERKYAEERISCLDHHDALTRLPNRAIMQDRLVQALGPAQRAVGSIIPLPHRRHAGVGKTDGTFRGKRRVVR